MPVLMTDPDAYHAPMALDEALARINPDVLVLDDREFGGYFSGLADPSQPRHLDVLAAAALPRTPGRAPGGRGARRQLRTDCHLHREAEARLAARWAGWRRTLRRVSPDSRAVYSPVPALPQTAMLVPSSMGDPLNTPSEQTVVMDYYSRIADRYDADMAVPDTERLRRCFWKLAAAHLPARGRLLDFGCGTGIDAQHFAAAGHDVVAYDFSPGMLRVLRERCRTEIGQGLVHPLGGTLMDLEAAMRERGLLDGVICNFAVLNLVDDPKPILRLLGRVVRAHGTLILSLLNPWYSENSNTALSGGACRALGARGRPSRTRAWKPVTPTGI